MLKGAWFSEDKSYRYGLMRMWGLSVDRLCMFVMLNPSTADAEANDPTIERCQRRAQQMGFDGIEVANLFALRSTDPRALYASADPVGDQNDRAILETAARAAFIVCGWGNHGKLLDRGKHVVRMLRAKGHKLHALNVNRSGQPSHPLYIGYDMRPTEMP